MLGHLTRGCFYSRQNCLISRYDPGLYVRRLKSGSDFKAKLHKKKKGGAESACTQFLLTRPVPHAHEINTQGNELEFTAIPEFTDEDIAAQALTFFTDGYETSSTALAVLIHDLACNPGVQQRLREEVDSVKGQHNGQLDLDIVQDMEYLDMVIQGNIKFRYLLRTDQHIKQ